ncbi:threonine--tRNA ligase [bacterium]|nr:threonine--tRNA ligase [bacterium]
MNSMNSMSSNDKLFRIRHSLAHIMAEAVIEHFQEEIPGSKVKLGVGPPIDNGFYYDFLLPRQIKEEDLLSIENRIKAIVQKGCRFVGREVSPEEARSLFADQHLKLELIEAILADRCDEAENQPPLSVYEHNRFVDLCKGPHVASADEIDIDALKVLSAAGAFWKGDEKREMLCRIYATAWQSEEQLKSYLEKLARGKERDHRKIGKALELFHFDESAPGMPYWLPNGLIVMNELLAFWREEHQRRGYKEFSAPLLNSRKLYEASGHWEHYRENMFVSGDGNEAEDGIKYGIKPMNCPNAMLIYNLKLRSYRDLPLRLSDCDPLHRNERSGTLHGLLRVQKFQQDDAHIFLAEDKDNSQIEAEFEEIFDLADYFYRVFDMQYEFRLSARPGSFMGEACDWEKAEALLKSILDRRLGEGKYKIAPGEGAFYGPKIDIMMRDSLDRSWQMGTIQLDYQLPRRFQCKYIAADGERKTPVLIHRVIYGSLDRFLGLLIEHTGGNLPLWLSPVQIAVLPVSQDQNAFARELLKRLQDNGFRAELNDENKSLNKRIRELSLFKIPYLVIVGAREADSGQLSVRARSGEHRNSVSEADFIASIKNEISTRAFYKS